MKVCVASELIPCNSSNQFASPCKVSLFVVYHDCSRNTFCCEGFRPLLTTQTIFQRTEKSRESFGIACVRVAIPIKPLSKLSTYFLLQNPVLSRKIKQRITRNFCTACLKRLQLLSKFNLIILRRTTTAR
jgi:hypothetical protein